MRHGPLSILLALTMAACSGAQDDDAVELDTAAAGASSSNGIIRLLAAGQAVFGVFPEQSAEGGTAVASQRDVDFVFYSLESGPWDIPTMKSFRAAMAEASGDREPPPMTLRIPPVRDDREAARRHLEEGIAAGISGVVLPHVDSVDDVALAVDVLGDRLWPLHPSGDLVNVILIEDQAGVANARALVGAAGVGVAIPGPGDLRRAYEGDMEAVEHAIQTVLAACVELDVPCGITAGAIDVAARLEQGFSMIIVTEPEALRVGLAASGRGS